MAGHWNATNPTNVWCQWCNVAARSASEFAIFTSLFCIVQEFLQLAFVIAMKAYSYTWSAFYTHCFWSGLTFIILFSNFHLVVRPFMPCHCLVTYVLYIYNRLFWFYYNKCVCFAGLNSFNFTCIYDRLCMHTPTWATWGGFCLVALYAKCQFFLWWNHKSAYRNSVADVCSLRFFYVVVLFCGSLIWLI